MQASPAFADGLSDLEPSTHAHESMLEALELVAEKPKTCGVYLLDEQDMAFVQRAIRSAS